MKKDHNKSINKADKSSQTPTKLKEAASLERDKGRSSEKDNSLSFMLDKQIENENVKNKNVLDVGSCKSCGRKFNKLMRLCPYCGIFNAMEATYKEPFCPNCAVQLEEKIYRDTDLLMCPLCNGMWVDTNEFNILTSEREVFSDTSIPFTYEKKPFDPNPAPYAKCVRCRRMMIQTNFKNISGILIYHCRDHGAWLNAGVLTELRTFIANGGLHEAHDKSIRENAVEIAHIAQKTENLEFMQKMLHRWSPKFLFFKNK